MNLNNIVQLYGYDFIFKDMVIDARLNKETVINSIMDYNAEFIPQYPEGCLLQKKIKTWSERIERGTSKMLDALLSDYNPIENAQRVETTHEVTSNNRNDTETKNRNDKETKNRNENYDNTSSESVSAYDETGYTPRSQTKEDNNVENTENNNVEITEDNNVEITEDNSLKSDEDGTRDIEYSLHGSIGVITPQDMIEKELKLREFNIYKWIAQDFFNELMLGVID